MKNKLSLEAQQLRDDFILLCSDQDFIESVQEECRASFKEFVCYYHMFQGWGTSKPQIAMAEWLQSSDDREPLRILQAYRHSAKSHITALYVVWRLFCDPDWTVIIVSATELIAGRNAAYIRKIVEHFPIVQHLKPSDPDHWKKTSFSVNRTTESLAPSVTITAVTSASTGMHSDMLLCDDVEILENSRTELKREEVWEKVQSFLSLSPQHLYVGTPHTKESIYSRLHETENFYHELKIPAKDEFGNMANPDVPINGELQDEAWLKRKEAGMTKAMFMSQFFLVPSDIEDSVLQIDMIRFFDLELRAVEDPLSDNYYSRWSFLLGNTALREIVAYYDPASGLKGRDDSVLAIAALDWNNNVYLLHVQILSAVTAEHAYEIQVQEVVESCITWGVGRVYVERNAHPTLYHNVSSVAKKVKARLFVKEALRGPTKSKNEFVADTLEPLIRSGNFWVSDALWKNEPKLRSQFQNFPNLRHDDVIDAVAGAVAQLHLMKGSATKDAKDRPMINSVPKHGVINKYVPARWKKKY
ncbi:phage terminase large subunit [Dongia sp.]|uniref:phage terminase large subunit n=1 Tax=Dongia sp. TaxID=1977262 RepID=UPI0035B1B1E1